MIGNAALGCAVTTSNELWCWGGCVEIDLGVPRWPSPVRVAPIAGDARLTMVPGGVCALSAGALACWDHPIARRPGEQMVPNPERSAWCGLGADLILTHEPQGIPSETAC
ncbi:MAG: hypothetical protein M3Y87_13970 [Myxococcota bacterium]|nr:hypothetical protein [Myxococcota bacterium]